MNNESLTKYNVLFVDDEMQVLKAIKRGLHLERYNKFFATSGKEALEIIEKEEIAMIITDMKMPQMDGLSLLKKVNEKNSDIVKVILSGYTNLAQIIATINALNIYKFILKPWDLKTELKPIIIEGLKVYEESTKYIDNSESDEEKNRVFKTLVATNQKSYKDVQNDFNSVKQLHKIIVNYAYFLALQLKEDKMNKLRLKEELSFIEKIVSGFVETLPAFMSITRAKNLQSEIQRIVEGLLENNSHENINFHSSIKENDDLPINLVHLSWFIRMILKDIVKITDESIVEIEMTGGMKDNTFEKVDFIIRVNHAPTIYDGVRKNTLYILSSAFANILKGSFKIDVTDTSTITLTVKI